MLEVITGHKYGYLTPIGFAGRSKNYIPQYECKCDCGKVVLVDKYKLLSGHTKSCGCIKRKHRHCLSDSKIRHIYNCWNNLIARCDNPNRKDSKYYHDKGITYCDEWKDFDLFCDWALSSGCEINLTIDRINGNKGYFPENCRWITIAEQQRNRSCNLNFTYKGETKTLTEWAREYSIDRTTLHDRIYKFGYSFEEALKKNKRHSRNSVFYSYMGEKLCRKELAERLGVSSTHIYDLEKRGLSFEQIIKTVKGE